MPDVAAGPPVDDPDQWTGRRADARRNHEAVLAAAREVFAVHGLEATIPAIAERAGVGKATVYRSYATKAELVDAIARDQIRWLDELVVDVSQRDDAFEALSELLGAIAGRLAEDRLFSQVLGQGSKWRDHEHQGLLERIITAAKAQGSLRADASTTDIQVLVGGFSRVLLDLGDRDPATWRRYTALVLDALRPRD